MARTTPQTVTQAPHDGGLQLVLAAETDIESAELARSHLLEAIAAAPDGSRIWLELASPDATAPALQLLLAARRSLAARDRFGGLGPQAAALLEPAGAMAGTVAFSSIRGAA